MRYQENYSLVLCSVLTASLIVLNIPLYFLLFVRLAFCEELLHKRVGCSVRAAPRRWMWHSVITGCSQERSDSKQAVKSVRKRLPLWTISVNRWNSRSLRNVCKYEEWCQCSKSWKQRQLNRYCHRGGKSVSQTVQIWRHDQHPIEDHMQCSRDGKMDQEWMIICFFFSI